ncbi:hypothetical protein LCGC14_1689940, partial [marine sediment metagenome]
MATTTSSFVAEVLKETYGDLHDQINRDTPILDLYEQSQSARWDGKVFVEALHHRRNQSAMGNSETGNLPNAGNQRYEELRIPLRRLYGGVQLSGQIMEQAKDQQSAFVNVLDAEVNGLVQDLRRTKERIIQGDGNATLCLVDGAGADDPTISVDAPGGVAGDVFGNRFLFPGQEVAIYNTAGTVVNAVRTVLSVSADGLQVTFTAAVSSAEAVDDGYITKGTTRGSVTQGSRDTEFMGIRGMFDDATYVSTFHGLDRTAAANGFFKVASVTSVGSISEDLFHRMLNACHERSGIIPGRYLTHYSVHREYIKRTQGDRRYTGDRVMNPDAGISGQSRTKSPVLAFNDVDFILGRYLDFGTIYL